MSVDFMPNDQQILTTSMDGEISMFSVKRQERVFHYETRPGMINAEKELRERTRPDDDIDLEQIKKETSNIMYACHTVKRNSEYDGVYLIGDEQGDIGMYKMDYNK